MIETEVTMAGPVFDGRAEAAAAAYTTHVPDVIAQEGVNRIRNYLPTVYEYLRNPGSSRSNITPGYYESVIHTERATPESVIVTDTPAVYGPWLEGVGSRNQSTRFKGYHTFRRITDELDAEAGVIAQRVLEQDGVLAVMNGAL